MKSHRFLFLTGITNNEWILGECVSRCDCDPKRDDDESLLDGDPSQPKSWSFSFVFSSQLLLSTQLRMMASRATDMNIMKSMMVRLHRHHHHQ